MERGLRQTEQQGRGRHDDDGPVVRREAHDGEPNERAATPGLQKKRLIWIVRSYIGPFC